MAKDGTKIGRVGLLGELAVEMALVQKGWHPVRLDTAQMASNADLLAINRKTRVSVQVKTTDAYAEHSHSKFLGFGYSTNYLMDRENNTIFNSKKSPLIADVIVGVSYHPNNTRFIVMPVVFAENLCRWNCDWWKSIDTKDGPRGNSFPIYINLSANRKSHTEQHGRNKRNLEKYEDAWHILNMPIEQLHDEKMWPLIE